MSKLLFMKDETELDYYHHRVSVRVVSRVANRLKTCKISIQSLKYSELEANVQLSTSKTFRRINYFASLQNFFTLFCPGMCVSVCVCMYVCVYVSLFPSTVKASPDWNKTIYVMPEIRPAMLCWGNYFLLSTFIATS